jgi:ammonia channel protein AmtB
VDPNTGRVFTYNGADIAWTLASTPLVWVMTPGVGFLYCGMVQRRNALSMLHLSIGTVAVVTFQVSRMSSADRIKYAQAAVTVVHLGILSGI